MNILIVNGPNLNLLGKREHDQYGSKTLIEIEKETANKLKTLGFDAANIEWFQSNSEEDIINKLQSDLILSKKFDGLVINPGGLTHSSVSILDTLKMVEIPIIEVHLSQIFTRESFRSQNLITTTGASEVIVGAKERVYILAILSIFLKGQK